MEKYMKCNCPTNKDTIKQIGHLLDCPKCNHPEGKDWEESFKEEFGIHFKGSSGELQFALKFIEDLLSQTKEEERKRLIEALPKRKKETSSGELEGTGISYKNIPNCCAIGYNLALKEIDEILNNLKEK